MKSHTVKSSPSGLRTALKESRSSRFNVPVRHPSKWSLLLERLLASPIRLHRYRSLSVRMVEDTFDRIDCGTRK